MENKTKELKVQDTVVVLDRVKVIGDLYLEKFASVNGTLIDGKLPKDDFGVYYRIALDAHSPQGMIYLNDYTGMCDVDIEKLLLFLIKAKEKISPELISK